MGHAYLRIGASARTQRLSRRALVRAGALCALLLSAPALAAGSQQVGSSTGLPLPRYVSLKADRVNLRQGPSKDHPIEWVFERAGLPVEVTEEFDTWRKIRDSEGTVGWVLESLLSGRRTALVKPWDKGAVLPIYANPDAHSRIVANLQSRVIGNVRSCNGAWCEIFGRGFEGWIQQTNLWGVYPNEKIN
ncbi:MAG TPA: SH3 domain-containing protein [Beijerinckiaceae bacterium]|nr:SH3 domain-containing protein [Beijerinckiaceae bacterium]